jgi:hypothetical protein
VDSREDQHRISDLSVEPYGFVKREEFEFGTNESHKISAHREKDEHAVHGEN